MSEKPFVDVEPGYWDGKYRCTRRWADSIPDRDWPLILRAYRLLRGQVEHYGFVGMSREQAKSAVMTLARDIDWAYYLASK